MLICPHSGLGNQIGNYVFGQYLILKGYDIKFLISCNNNIDRAFMLDKFNTNLPVASKNDIENFIKGNPSLYMYKTLLKNILYRRRYYFNSLFKVLKRIRNEYNIYPKKNLKFLSKILSYKDILTSGEINCAVCDCYTPIQEFEEEKFKNKIRNDFTLKEELDEKNLIIAKKIENSKNSTGIHIRRGDYLKLNIPVVKKKFILDKMDFLNNKLSNVEFFIFSDDINWAKENINSYKNITFVDNNDEQNGYMDFYLFNKCIHRIYSASSFSMWVKYLNPNKNCYEFIPKKSDLTIEK